jgi:hypothetical protein
MNAASGASGVKSKQGRVMGPRKLSGPVRPPLAQAPSPAPSRNTHRGSAPADRLAANAIEAGAAGVISQVAQPAEIIDAIHRVHVGEMMQPAQEITAPLRLLVKSAIAHRNTASGRDFCHSTRHRAIALTTTAQAPRGAVALDNSGNDPECALSLSLTDAVPVHCNA